MSGPGDFLIFEDDLFVPHVVDDPRAVAVLRAAADRAAEKVRTSDLLFAIINGGDVRARSVLSLAMRDGARLRDIVDGIELYSPARQGGSDFSGRREQFTGEALDALDAFDAELADGFAAAPELRRDVGLELLAACTLEHLDEDDRKYLPILDAARAARALREQIRIMCEPPAPLIDETTGRLRSDEFTEAGWAALQLAARRATELGYDQVLPPHCLLGLLGETEGLAEILLRRQLPPQIGLAKVTATLTDAFRRSDRPADTAPLPLTVEAIGDPLVELLRGAQRTAAVREAELIGTGHLLDALLDKAPPRLLDVLQAAPLGLSVARLREHLDQALRDTRSTPLREVAFRLPDSLPRSADLTWLARTEEPPPALRLDGYFDQLLRALHRTTGNHVLITGLPGVGTTTLLRELARRAACGDIPFLRRKRFVHIDCHDVAAADGTAVLSGIIAHVADRTDLITCIDGLGALLRGAPGGDPRMVLRRALRERRVHLVGVLQPNEFEDLIAADQVLMELTSRVDVAEPGRAEARDMVRQAADTLAAEFHLTIDDRVVDRAVLFSGDYLLSERLPAKAIRVLRRACEDLDFRRTQEGAERSAVDVDDVAAVIAEISGVPAGQISGRGGERTDLEASLAEAVVGQEDAVREVAAELRRIKAGLTGSARRPATVLFFAGVTGVGKTELAKTVARLYSASKRLQTYPMENFGEPHSVSGIIGSPPGYVGHDQGGRLINDLNADPYCVFLLDEAEKAHPDVWHPFLNLFDEGWIVDQRGVKAFADRAVFILTSNAGHQIIERMTQEGKTAEEIAEAVEQELRRMRNPRSGQPSFTPEFLGRIRRIIVFRPLADQAIDGIVRKALGERVRFWHELREKELVVADPVVGRLTGAAITMAPALGGRAAEKAVTELVDNPILRAAERRPDEYERCARIALVAPPAGRPEIDVRFEGPSEEPS